MARLARLVVPGFPRQVAHHGNRRCEVFLQVADLRAYRDYDDAYSFDDVGNRTALTRIAGGVTKATAYSHNAAHELTQLIYGEDAAAQYTKTYGYDAAGRTTRVTKQGDGLTTVVHTYDWDAADRLTRGARSHSFDKFDARAPQARPCAPRATRVLSRVRPAPSRTRPCASRTRPCASRKAISGFHQ